MVKYNLTKKLQKSSSPTRSLSPYQLRVFIYFCRVSCHIKKKLWLKLPESYYQYMAFTTCVILAILVLPSIFTAKLYLVQTNVANSVVVRWGYFAYYFAVSVL